MNVLNKIKEVKTLLQDKSKWTQGTYARNIDCRRVNVESPDAVCFCWLGACYFVAENNWSDGEQLKGEFKKDIKEISMSILNDTLGYEAVMKSIDKTIARLEKQV